MVPAEEVIVEHFIRTLATLGGNAQMGSVLAEACIQEVRADPAKFRAHADVEGGALARTLLSRGQLQLLHSGNFSLEPVCSS